jgi:ABC-type uncharacterized transport system substrate-binding protein
VIRNRFLFFLGVASVFLCMSAAVSHAHPHVFIVQRLKVQFDDRGLAGIQVQWKLDDMFAGMIAEDYDRNRNGVLEPAEVQIIKEKAFSNLSGFGYFTFIKIDGKPFRVRYIKDFNAILQDHKLVYEFFIPCHVRATDHAKKISVATYDPSYYTAIFFSKREPVSLVDADPFAVKTAVREDPDTKIYFDMIHPWTLFLEFELK